ncbi:MAG TPA: nicotinate (nicotinamide) nucleotide adenylyltransferase, partial [Bacteroidia bacterium]|nr:nicotinate (nicotinamide) nucleotide adenylyltransferase [Bacteroidia bacterium]
MKIGLYFGSFNPVHNGHMVIANYMAEFAQLDQVWMVVSPQNPLKAPTTLLSDTQRLAMVKIAIGDYKKLKASNIEFKLPKPSYTIHTLVYLSEKYPQHEFALIMGADSLATLPKWKNHEAILEHYHIYVYPRPQITLPALANNKHVHIVNAPLMELSSSFIRNAIKAKHDVRFMVPH